MMTDEQVRWKPYSEASIDSRAPQGLSFLCFRDQQYLRMMRHLVFDMYINEYTVHRVMRQFGLYQASSVPVTHTLSAAVHR
jgi:hypothetical protein